MLPKLFCRLRRKNLVIRFSVKMVFRNAKRPLSRLVCVNIFAVHVLDPGKPGQLLHEPRKTLLAFLKSDEGLLCRGYVGTINIDIASFSYRGDRHMKNSIAKF